ncbi:hypothetical protein ACSAGD_10480 [Paramicrobacterium sp. CJ85]|uniref:hypothetical protein n=1 Tax=Paramicrobacterium sp. CJ85 TaxID=3445355 RepID=UPI003F607F31
MTRDDIKWELEMKADRVLYRLSAEQIVYLGDAFPWTVTEEDLANDGLVDMVRRSALRLGHEAALAAKGANAFFPVAI